ncbi:sterol 3-beta-glucosyltransferase [Peziza echinospora]|nr:sterol 3-beta-glucosyltransferase [Peziza echinospora]
MEDDESRDDAAVTAANFNMHQSIFQLITAAGSNPSFNNRSELSSDSDGERDDDTLQMPHNILRSVATLKKPRSSSSFRNRRMLQSTPHLRARPSILQTQPEDQDTDDGASTAGPPSPSMVPVSKGTHGLQPQVLTAALDASLAQHESENTKSEDEGNQTDHSLAYALMNIFGLPEPEDIISEYPCWLLKNALLPGFMYITSKHVCFYAYLPKNNNDVVKTGRLFKRGHSNPKYREYWFILKGHVLSYYKDPKNTYFPSGHIDLRNCDKAETATEKGVETEFFTLRSAQRDFKFKADSAPSRKQWITALNKSIDRWKNEGDSVKILLPIKDIELVEETSVLEFADTIKLNFVDKEEHIFDDYSFSFFSFGKEALKLLRILVENAAVYRLTGIDLTTDHFRTTLRPSSRTASLRSASSRSRSPRSPIAKEFGSPFPPPRNSGESRRSLDIPGRPSLDALNNSKTASDSFSDAHSKGSSLLESDGYQISSDDETSASQILAQSRIFQRPTLKPAANSAVFEKKPAPADIVVHPPTRSSTVQPQTAYSQSQQASTSPQQSPGNHKKADGWAGWMKSRSKTVATKPMGYLGKMSDIWSGGKSHTTPIGAMPNEQPVDPDDEDGFREKFALQPSEKLRAVYYGYLYQVIPLYGMIYVSDHHFCYRSTILGTRTKLILPLKDIENVDGEGGFSFGLSGLVVTIRAHEELFFEFGYQDVRNDCLNQLIRAMDLLRMEVSIPSLKDEERDAEAAKREYNVLKEARLAGHSEHEVPLPSSRDIAQSVEIPPIVFDDPQTSFISFKPTESLRITCLTIGSRGDVQPYIALCKGFLKEGHKPRIATHAEFQPWIESHGIEFALVEGDPAELMRVCVENGMFTFSFLKEASSKFRGWIDELLSSAWEACQGSDILIESPSAMAGIHIAEALQIPYFRAFTMPWTRTRAYPHAFAVPERKMGGHYNSFTYVMFDNVFWQAISGQVNRWRKKSLGLPSTNLDKLQPNKTPFLYNFSPSVVVRPLDYSDWIKVTGYWFLEEKSTWEPPKELLEFIRKAREDGKKIVYVGFGSIVVSDPEALTRSVVESIGRADVRCILSKGWSDRLGSKNQNEVEIPMPDYIHTIKSAPHDWLFAQVDAAAHHGGAGTTGASLRAGIPTIVKPFFGDQFFFGGRVEDLGVGICIKKLNVAAFTAALKVATHDHRMITKARVLGEQIRMENGVETAIQTIYREMEYAKGLIKQRAAATTTTGKKSVLSPKSEDEEGDHGHGEEKDEASKSGVPDYDSESSFVFVDGEDEHGGM